MSTLLQSCLALKLVPALAKLIRCRSGGSRAAAPLKATAAAEISTVRHSFFVTLDGHKKAGMVPVFLWIET